MVMMAAFFLTAAMVTFTLEYSVELRLAVLLLLVLTSLLSHNKIFFIGGGVRRHQGVSGYGRGELF